MGFGLGWGLGGLGYGLGGLWGPATVDTVVVGYPDYGYGGYGDYGGDGYGSMLYDWGTAPYDNPYYNPAEVVVQQPIIYDYSQPISTTATQPTQAISDLAGTSFDQARAAFKLGN